MTDPDTTVRSFDKYNLYGAYHWEAFSCDPRKRDSFTRARYSLVEKVVGANRNTRSVLDLGCGDGALLYWIGRRTRIPQLTGVEPDPEGRRLARERLNGLGMPVPILETTSQIRDHSQDVVLCADVVEHVENDDAFIEEVARMISPSGAAIFTTPVRRDGRPSDPEHFREYAFDAFERLVERHLAVSSHRLFTPFWTFALYTWSPRWTRGRTPLAWLIGLFDMVFRINVLALRCRRPTSAINQLLVAESPNANARNLE